MKLFLRGVYDISSFFLLPLHLLFREHFCNHPKENHIRGHPYLHTFFSKQTTSVDGWWMGSAKVCPVEIYTLKIQFLRLT